VMPDELDYLDSTAITGNGYYYEVRAVNDIGESIDSNSLYLEEAIPIVPPGAPTWGYVVPSPLTPLSVGAYWNAPADNGGSEILSYTIYKRIGVGGVWTPLAVPGVTEYHDYEVTYGGDYYYKVYATNSAGDGPFSAVSAHINWPI